MPIDRFIKDRKTVWQRLEELLNLLDRMTLRRLHREEVRELGRIYRRTASDLAIARAESRDPRLVNYLNSLVIRAHGRIYRADAQGGRRIRDFFARDFPQSFRRTWRYTATAFGVFLLFNGAMFGAIIALTYRAGFGNDLLLGFVVSHGVIELSCIFIAGGAGLLIGTALLMPGDLSRGDALKSRGMEAVRLIIGCVPLLVVAGIIEGFISPQPISPIIKISIGALTGIALYSYLFLVGREPAS